MLVKIRKLHKDAVIPQKAHETDAGFDLTAITNTWKDGYLEYGTGLAVEIPNGFVGLIFPRSSISKTGLHLCNSVGVIDSDYRGEIRLRFYEASDHEDAEGYGNGDRIGQLIILPYPQVVWEVVDELGDTERGEGGFGSTSS